MRYPRHDEDRPFLARAACLVMLAGMLAMSAAPAVHAQDDGANTAENTASDDQFDAQALIDRINREFRRNNYDKASTLLEELVRREPSRPRAWSALGYALQQQKRYMEALPAQLMASEFRRTRATACYNIACIYAIRGMTDKSIGWLESAVDAGFQNSELMANDPDLRSIRSDPRYVKLHEAMSWRTTLGPEQSGRDPSEMMAISSAPPETLPARQHFDFWIGDWNVYSDGETQIGTSRVEHLMGGHLIRETWTSARGDRGMSTNYYDASNDSWSQVWIDDNGQVIRMNGGLIEGVIRLNGSCVLPDGRTRAFRSEIEPRPDGTVRQVMEASNDGGQSWTTWFLGNYRRAGGKSGGAEGTTMNPKELDLDQLGSEDEDDARTP